MEEALGSQQGAIGRLGNLSDKRKIPCKLDLASWSAHPESSCETKKTFSMQAVKMGDIVSLHLRDLHIAATTNAFCAVPWRDDMTPRGRGPVPLCSVSLHNGTLSPFSVLFCSLRFSATDVS